MVQFIAYLIPIGRLGELLPISDIKGDGQFMLSRIQPYMDGLNIRYKIILSIGRCLMAVVVGSHVAVSTFLVSADMPIRPELILA